MELWVFKNPLSFRAPGAFYVLFIEKYAGMRGVPQISELGCQAVKSDFFRQSTEEIHWSSTYSHRFTAFFDRSHATRTIVSFRRSALYARSSRASRLTV